ncbi:hypothetical protein Ccar_17405 [Clostridium carboxidivorans P7]|uniref:Uncharacterized protein n=1 Tax=Clostridium carboxidivorans P7 TaxID=536227 RepID=C6PW11_9CLOT|nr:hypothetical protein [Clostridium carboxidivorans]AKN32540.1 hypothetical protein Ccar_17405 [Clostridium carboxidivorans P7]EET86558.1 hypothetical protein CcarbDRAFT_2978 [Clostridium carboxidivorans P7]EFG87732.1 hypothetical protein CLCAR_2583 [Clostridium carboxidivorans P7]
MSKKNCCSDTLSKDNECIIEFKPCEMIKNVNINVEPEEDECCCNFHEEVDDRFIMALVCTIIKQLDFRCEKHSHKHKHKHRYSSSSKHHHS